MTSERTSAAEAETTGNAPTSPAPHYLPPCRRVKVAWLGGIIADRRRARDGERIGAHAALKAIDLDDRLGLVAALRKIRDEAEKRLDFETRDLAEGAARGVEGP